MSQKVKALEWTRGYLKEPFSEAKVTELPNGFKLHVSELSHRQIMLLGVAASDRSAYPELNFSVKRSGTGITIIVTV